MERERLYPDLDSNDTDSSEYLSSSNVQQSSSSSYFLQEDSTHLLAPFNRRNKPCRFYLPPYSEDDPLKGNNPTYDLWPNYDISLPNNEGIYLNARQYIRSKHASSYTDSSQSPVFRENSDDFSEKRNNHYNNPNVDVVSFKNFKLICSTVKPIRSLRSPKKTTHYENEESERQYHYDGWMKWRTNVNKQLAIIILLNQNKDINLRKSDLYRGPLNWKSIDYLMKNAKENYGKKGDLCSQKCSDTSMLKRKSFIMFGIPRVDLSSIKH